MAHNSSPSVLTSSITVSADTTTHEATENSVALKKIITDRPTETTEKTTATAEATEKTMTTSAGLKETIPTTEATERAETTTGATGRTVATTGATEKAIMTATSTATSMPAKATTPATYGTYIVIHYVDETGANVANNTGATTFPTMPPESLSFYTAAFWVPVAILSLVMAMTCIRTIWRLYARKRKNNISSYESRFVLSEEINVAYDRLNEPDNIYVELERMSTTASFSNSGGGSQYYSTVSSFRDHANFRSDNRALADPAFSREEIIPDGQQQRVSKAHSYLYLIP